jgi:hypothetical protein
MNYESGVRNVIPVKMGIQGVSYECNFGFVLSKKKEEYFYSYSGLNFWIFIAGYFF